MKYLVTGGAGFIGSHLTRALQVQGHQVDVLDIHQPFRERTVLDLATLQPMLAECDAVFHLAAVVGFKHVMADPWTTITTELDGMRTMITALALDPKPMLYTSSSAVYGRGIQPSGAQELDDCVMGPPTTPSWSYAWAKGAAEVMAVAAARQMRLPIRIVRLFNVVGAGQSAAAGFVLPRMVDRSLQGLPLTVYAPGTQTRTFGHVRDIIDGLIDLMDCPAAIGEITNLGGTETRTMWEVAELIRHTTASAARPQLIPQPYGPGYDDIVDRKPDLRKAQRIIGYRPTRTLVQAITDLVVERTTKEAVVA